MESLILKKKQYEQIFWRLGIFLIVSSCTIFGVMVFLQLGDTLQVGLPINQFPTIIIDPGHGGIDGGAVGNNIIEKDINLAISLKLRDMLAINGYDVVLTREIDTSIHDPKYDTIKQQKTSDIYNRLAFIKKYPNSIFISIHQNKFTESKYSGAQVFYSANNPDSEVLAELLQATIVNKLQSENKRLVKKAYDSLYLMRKATIPAVLVECGFLSNPTEAKLLSDEEYQSKLAFVIFGTIANFLTQSGPIK